MNTPAWVKQSIFYHIYPLGMFGAAKENSFDGVVDYKLDQMYSWLDHLQWLGVNAIYLGPVFESATHGYDTVDYYKIDSRLGDEESFTRLVDEIHRRGMKVVLDGVFNHVGRAHFAFRDVQYHGQASHYGNWFAGLDFSQSNPYGDPFTYQTWGGHFSLPKLNLHNPETRAHLLNAVRFWMERWQIDGLRLDAADNLDHGFLQDLCVLTKSLSTEFWLMGEVVHGDYRRWANQEQLHSVTNYECYKGLYSSLNDQNYFEIAYALNRQFSEEGVYQHLWLYNFVDNHDVNRVASQLIKTEHLYPLYALLFTMPGIPSIYYGSEWGINGKRNQYSDEELRPYLDLNTVMQTGPHPNLTHYIRRLVLLRNTYAALRFGSYQEIFVSSQQLVFKRSFQGQEVIVVLNAADQPVDLNSLPLDLGDDWKEICLRPNCDCESNNNHAVPPYGTKIFVSEEISGDL